MHNKKTTLKANIQIALIIGIIIIFYLAMWYWVNRLSTENRIEDQKVLSDDIVSQIDNAVFSKARDIIQFISLDSNIKAFCSSDGVQAEKETVLLLNTVKRMANASLCYVMDENGITLQNSEYKNDYNYSIRGISYAFRPYFKEAAKGKNAIYPGLGITTNERGLYYSAPIYSDNKTLIGVFVIKMDMAVIDKLLGQYSNDVVLTTSNKIVFSTNQPEWLFKYMDSIGQDQLKEAEASRQFGNKPLQPIGFSEDNDTVTIKEVKYNIMEVQTSTLGWHIITLMPVLPGYALTHMQKSFIVEVNIAFVVLFTLIIILDRIILNMRRKEDQLRKLSVAVEQSPLAVMITDFNGSIQYVNSKSKELTGYEYQELLGKKPNVFKSHTQSDLFYKELWKTILSGEKWQGEFCNKKKNGELYWESAIIAPVKNTKNEVTNFIALKEDITERKLAEERLNTYATTDEMTGAFNRRTGFAMLKELLELSKREGKRLVVCFADINGLKSINDTLGHNSGDELIKQSVNTIRKALRESDIICRLGGDEFLIIFPNSKIENVKGIWHRIEEELEAVNQQDIHSFIISVSYGFSEFDPKDEINIDELISIADTEMYNHKKKIKEALGPEGVLKKL